VSAREPLRVLIAGGGDEGIREGWHVELNAEPSGKRVLVVGAGPSGLSAAYFLARLGHTVTHGANSGLNTDTRRGHRP
jgi:NADPH-dependent glutamate synthase beta subunit-like oxidoreductase